MNPPEIYYEWIQILKVIEQGSSDSEALAALQAGYLEQQSGVYERFLQRLTHAVNTRLNLASNAFNHAISQNDGSDAMLNQALNELSRNLAFVPKLAKLPVLQEQHQAKFLSLIQDEIDRIGKSLISTAQKDKSGRLTSILKSKGFKV